MEGKKLKMVLAYYSSDYTMSNSVNSTAGLYLVIATCIFLPFLYSYLGELCCSAPNKVFTIIL